MSETDFFRPRPPTRAWLWIGLAIVAVSIWQLSDPVRAAALDYAFGVVPAHYQAGAGVFHSPTDFLLPLVGHAFLHGSWLHLGVNMLVYFQLSSLVERRLSLGGAAGDWRFALLFLVSAIGGAVGFVLIAPNTDVPAIGASGAICGIFAAYLLGARPRWQDALKDRRIQQAALIFLAVNVALMAFLTEAGVLPIAWEAHLGGFVAGGVAFVLLAPRPRLLEGPWGRFLG
ncbi:MAG: rhomboid family intramembrane serine protease [Hydrogenophilaceae bacterium]|nr:rhomboid family intramembrane serine protease [Hydrogenophilaceae bacterium]